MSYEIIIRNESPAVKEKLVVLDDDKYPVLGPGDYIIRVCQECGHTLDDDALRGKVRECNGRHDYDDNPISERGIKNYAKKSHLALVREFMESFRQDPMPQEPNLGDLRLRNLRFNLIQEELTELYEALASQDMVQVADALADLEYVVLGAYIAFGMNGEAIFQEVHRSNMSKLDAFGKPVMREDGKVLKGRNYSPPNLERILGL